MLVPKPLPLVTFTAGGSATVLLRDLPKRQRGKIMHLVGFILDVTMTPTFASGSVTLAGTHNLVTRLVFNDGRKERFNGSLYQLRAMERMLYGRQILPDVDSDHATTVARSFRRVLLCGPPSIGGESDFAIPTGALQNGELRFTFGALSDISATVTACTGTVRVVALMQQRDDLIIPPDWRFFAQSANGDTNIAGKALPTHVALTKDTAMSAISAGDIGNIRLDFGNGDVLDNTNAEALGAAFSFENLCGPIGGVQGEPNQASDTWHKNVDPTSPTALVDSTADLQMVYWLPSDGQLTKQDVCEGTMLLKWDGSDTSLVALVGRIEPHTEQSRGSIINEALKELGKSADDIKDAKVSTDSKNAYKGPLKDFLPVKVKV